MISAFRAVEMDWIVRFGLIFDGQLYVPSLNVMGALLHCGIGAQRDRSGGLKRGKY